MDEREIFTVFIAEDEQPARELLVDYILKRSELKLEGWSKNGRETYNKLCAKDYDLLFLDINLPVMSGIEIVDKLSKPPYIIFTTAYDEYAIKAFELGAVDYLLKPFSEERFNTSVNKALSAIKNKGSFPNTSFGLGLSIKEDENYYILPYDDILYISSHGRFSHIHTQLRVYKTGQTLKEIQHKIPFDNFIRIHKKYIVNINYVSHMQYLMGGQYVAFLKDTDNTTLTIGRIFVPEVRKKLTF